MSSLEEEEESAGTAESGEVDGRALRLVPGVVVSVWGF